MEFSGRLAAFPVADILQWVHNDRRTGSLVVRRSGCEKRVYFSEGEIVACFSDDAAEFFGQHLLVQGLVDEGRLIQALTRCRNRGELLGTALVELRILDLPTLARALGEHVEDQVCEIFLWKNGIFYFDTEMVPPEQQLPEPLSSAAAALEGSRRADEVARIRRVFVHDQVVLEKGREKPPEPSALDQRILEVVDGRRSLAQLYTEVRGSWFRFLEAAYRLTVESYLEISEVNDIAESHSSELRLADLLIEQVAEEQTVYLRQHLAIPFEALAHYVPVWIRAPGAEEESRTSPSVLEFYGQVDGRATLAELLDPVGSEERSRRLDRLVLQLRRGSLALVPVPVADLDHMAGGASEESGRGPGFWRRVLGGA